MAYFASILARPATWQLAGVPEGADALVLADLARQSGGRDILHVARDGNRLQRLIEALQFFAPGREVIGVPAWDCLPYDRLSPHADIVSQRLDALSRLSRGKRPASPARIVIVSVGALLQRVPPRSVYAQAGYRLKPGDKIDLSEFTSYLSDNGYGRSGYGNYGYNAGADLSFNCEVRYDGRIRDIDINRRSANWRGY